MRNNETGEFELVVGNRQIMSGFFIVVLLFAVGVAMGYFLGQNSPRSAKLAVDSSTSATTPVSDARPQPAAPVSSAPPAADPAPAPAQPPAEAVRRPEPRAAREPVPSTAADPPQTAPSTVPEAAAGVYWQVMAVGKTDAEIVVRTLRNKGFPATASPGTKGLTRVLVGPFAERAALGKAKGDLESAGFSSLYKIEISGDRK